MLSTAGASGRFLVASVAAFATSSCSAEGPNDLDPAAKVGRSSAPLRLVEAHRLVANDGAAHDAFGISVAVDGDTAVVGAYRDDVGLDVDQGSAYVFVRSGTTWTEQDRLFASDGAPQLRFGHVVALSGDTAVVGVADSPTPSVAVYVFVRSGPAWSEQQRLTASDGAPGHQFGASIAIDGETIVVGAPRAPSAGSLGDGAAYVFVRSGMTWSQQAKLVGSEMLTDAFGASVSIADDRALVGAPRSTFTQAEQGLAYLFQRTGTTWSTGTFMVGSPALPGDLYGQSVAVNPDHLLVSAPMAEGVFLRQGLVHADGVWLAASDAAQDDTFGSTLALSGELALVRGGGATYLWDATGAWSEEQIISRAGDLALEGPTALIGQSSEDVGPNVNQGAAYVYSLVGGTCAVGSECVTGFCVGGVCCDTLCAGPCDSCVEPGSVGICSIVPGCDAGAGGADGGDASTDTGASDGGGADTGGAGGTAGADAGGAAGSSGADAGGSGGADAGGAGGSGGADAGAAGGNDAGAAGTSGGGGGTAGKAGSGGEAGIAGAAGSAGSSGGGADDEGGCGCRTSRARVVGPPFGILFAFLGAAARRSFRGRRRLASPRRSAVRQMTDRNLR